MDKSLIERIEKRLAALGKTERQASMEATGKPDAIRAIRSGRTRNPRIDTIHKLAGALEVSPQWLLTGEDGAPLPPSAVPAALPPREAMPADVPVMGTAAGSHLSGAFQLEPGAVDYVRRPPALLNARDIYALYVENTSMVPQFAPGDLIFVHPHKPVRVGDAVIVQQRNAEHDAVSATIGVFRRRNERAVLIEKHNPVATVEIDRTTIIAMHKVLTANELFGI